MIGASEIEYVENNSTIDDIAIDFQIPNGKVGDRYQGEIDLFNDVEKIKTIYGIGKIGGVEFDKKSNSIIGTPQNAGEFLIEFDCLVKKKKVIKLIVNQDPKKLWKNIESNQEHKVDDDSLFLQSPKHEKDIVVASKRGRSHEHNGTQRDDHYDVRFYDDWFISIVADGAGSAPLSSLGSKIACETAGNIIAEALADLDKKQSVVDAIDEYSKNNTNAEAKKKLKTQVYKIIVTAAYEAHKAIAMEAKSKGEELKLYHTTLLITICRKINQGYFVGGFQIGDGISAILKKGEPVKLLGWPDSGEYAGQTNFITDARIFKTAEALMERIYVEYIQDFDAIYSMTDGISDPLFGDEKNLKLTEKWNEFNNNVTEALNLENGVSPDKNLLKWMEFYEEREHDDRTLVIIL